MKKTSWKTIREILAGHPVETDLFLTLIDESGAITCANAAMVRDFEITHPRQIQSNFFDLIHPIHHDLFRQAMKGSSGQEPETEVEIYVKNGLYHPMKWAINCLAEQDQNSKAFLCVGYKIADDKKVIRFNELLSNHAHLVVEGMSGVCFQDSDGNILAANQKMAGIFETSLENLYRITHIRELWNNTWIIKDEEGKTVSFEETPFIKASRTGQPQSRTMIIRLSSGQERWVLLSSQPLPEKEATGYHPVVSSAIDLTSEKLMAGTLREKEALISAFLQETPDLAWVIDEEATLHFASNSFKKHFGIGNKEGSAPRVTDIVPLAVTRAVFDYHLRAFRTGEPVQATEKIRWADGSHSLSHIHIFPIRNVPGKKLVGGIAVYTPDTQEKSRLEKELKIVKDRLSNLSRATSDAIWEWDMQNGHIFRNEKLMEMVGYQADNSKGLSWWLRRIHPEDRNRLADKVKEATENLNQSWQEEYRFRCADGSYLFIRDNGFVVYENGLPVKMIGSLKNISSVKELENQLADVRLQQQREISETAIRVQEKERTRIGHELHDNVNQLLSTVKLLFNEINPGSSEQRKLKDKSIEYLQQSIDEIRKLSKELVTPQLKKEKLSHSIQSLISDISLPGKLKISFNHDLDEEALSTGKKITIFRIVQEQVKNILKHSRASKVEINLTMDAENLRLVIEDNGKGFDPKLTRQGIGLSNIHERAQFYNGSLELRSGPGKGCALTVTIPTQD